MSNHGSGAPLRTVRDVVFVDGLRTPFGRAGEKGIYAGTRADDLIVKCIRELLRRNPSLPAARIDEVAIAATTQTGGRADGGAATRLIRERLGAGRAQAARRRERGHAPGLRRL